MIARKEDKKKERKKKKEKCAFNIVKERRVVAV